ncbi:MAG: AAA family ATPase [Umezawaea sp.]
MRISERAEKLQKFYRAFQAEDSSRGSITLLQGPMTSGKTSFLFTLGNSRRDVGDLVLTATTSPGEQQLRLGIMSQLLHRVPLSGQAHENVTTLLAEPYGGNSAGVARWSTQARHDSTAIRELGGVLLRLAEREPVLVLVDDVENSDPLSLQCLAFAARRSHRDRLHMVLATDGSETPDFTRFEAEVGRLPHFHRMRITTQDVVGVEDVLRDHATQTRAAELAPSYHAITGGNLMLLNAVIADSATTSGLGEPVTGATFEDAVRICLRRCDEDMVLVTKAMAVLGGDAGSTKLISSVSGLSVEQVNRALEALREIGLLDACRLQHPAIVLTVLESLTPAERAQSHGRAAERLHETGATAATVADHLIAAGGTVDAWGVAALRKAADQALEDRRPEIAVKYLEVARQLSADQSERAAITTKLATVEWRVSPATATRHLPKLIAALRAGTLTHTDATTMIRYLLWHGRLDDAEDALEHLVSSVTEQDTHSAAELNLFRLWLMYSYPTLLERVPAAHHALNTETSPADIAAAPQLQAATLLNTVLKSGTYDNIVVGAEHLLKTCQLSDTTLEPLMTAVAALIYADRLSLAASRTDALLDQALEQNAASWQAELSSLRSVVAVRAGDLNTAADLATAALTHVEPSLWGTRVGAPLASLVLAHTGMGNHHAAEAVLELPVPAEMFQTGFGLYYWQARGHHYLATGRTQAAERDFEACGELMTRWGTDLPGLVAWRNDLAMLHLRCGARDRARELVEDQLARLPQIPSRARGVALRLLAAAGPEQSRLALLEESAEVLEVCGAELELAYTLMDLGRAHQERGELDRARTTERRAWQLAKRCGASLRLKSQSPRRLLVEADLGDTRQSEAAGALSEAELNVAALAARRHTNREIARKLYITVSTVEQHLTRAYRKLRVNRREDLPTELQPVAAESA